jgi:hypothetical protein
MGFLKPLPIPEKKWELVTINFITKFLRTTRKHNYKMVVVDILTKDVHFIPVNITHTTTDIVKNSIREIARLYCIPKEIVSDRDTKFTSNFWRGLFKGFGTNMNFSTRWEDRESQSDGKTERVNQVIEDMLRMYVMDKPSKWEDYLHLVEFSYNNGYQNSLKMSPFEALYGRK